MNPPKMPIHIGDYKRDTGHLRALEHGAYLMLLFHYWSTGALPDDDRQLSTIACMTPAEWRRTKPILERFFKAGWKHGRVEEDLALANANYEKRAKAGAEGGKAKANSKQSSSKNVAMLEQESSNALATDNLLPKKDAASAVPAPQDVDYYRRVREVLGSNAGGLGKQLLTAKDGNIALARAAIEQASTKGQGAREYVGAIIRNRSPPPGEASRYVDPRL